MTVWLHPQTFLHVCLCAWMCMCVVVSKCWSVLLCNGPMACTRKHFDCLCPLSFTLGQTMMLHRLAYCESVDCGVYRLLDNEATELLAAWQSACWFHYAIVDRFHTCFASVTEVNCSADGVLQSKKWLTSAPVCLASVTRMRLVFVVMRVNVLHCQPHGFVWFCMPWKVKGLCCQVWCLDLMCVYIYICVCATLCCALHPDKVMKKNKNHKEVNEWGNCLKT